MIIAAIVIAISLSVRALLVIRGCAWGNQMKLLSGLAISVVLAIVHTVLFYTGLLTGDILRFDESLYDTANALVFMGISAVVALRWLFQVRRKSVALPSYNLSRVNAVLAFAFASGISVFMVGLGFGFVCKEPRWFLAIPLFVQTLVGAYFGVMFGRRHVEMNVRRWQLLSALLLLSVAVSFLI
ncbi:MAG: manganese efflux pump [Bacteroidales bacterium]|nr:manganese efflux pump [Bacteroidales bacterium]